MPARCPRAGALPAGACGTAGRGSLSRQPVPAVLAGPRRVWAHARRAGSAHLPSGPPGRAVQPPPGARQAPAAAASPCVSTASSRRRRCRTSLAALPSAGRGPTAPPPASGPVPCRPPARGRAPPAGGGRGRGSTALLGRPKPRPGCPAPSSAAISRLGRVRAPVRAPALSLPHPPCSGLPSCAPLPSRSPARALMSGTRLFPPRSFDAGARAPSLPPAPFPGAAPPAPAHPPLPPASRGPAELPASASPVACGPHLPQPCPDTTLAAPTPTGRAFPGETLPRPPASPPCPALLALFPRGPEVSPPLPPFDVEARPDAALRAPGLCCHRICLRAWAAAGRGLCMPTSCSARAWATR